MRLPVPRLPSPDAVLSSLDAALRTFAGAAVAARERPSADTQGQLSEMSEADRQRSAALMRVNHVGEVCAQALYQAQALTARTAGLRQQMLDAARDEVDHLAWTQARLRELNDRPSLLNPLWYAGSFAIGLAAGALGDRVSLGFVAETERQVEAHLASHLERLPALDGASRAIVDQMKIDEARHAHHADDAGGVALPMPVRRLMTLAAKVMTTTAQRI